MTLRLAPSLTLPDEAVTQTFGILAKRSAGKSNAGAVMAEEMHKAGLPFVVVDPVGAWWGLRSAGDGKGAGLPIPIFGGYRGDVPLEPSGGALIADLVVAENLSAVLDVSTFDSENAKRRFLWGFAERLYALKGKPGNDTPLHLFLEEADDYAPQKANGEIARTLGAFERIVKRGRARGLGCTMISQRSASVNKDLLNQIETLIVLRTVAPLDIAAIAGWLKYHGQSEEILESLHALNPGEAWVWSPWLELTKRVQMRRRRTFDSGATPGVKAKRVVATLADIDLGAIATQMFETIERAKADDPAHLRKQIADLKRELASARSDFEHVPEPKTITVEIAHVPPETVEALGHIRYESDTLMTSAKAFNEAMTDMAKRIQEQITSAIRTAGLPLKRDAPKLPPSDAATRVRQMAPVAAKDVGVRADRSTARPASARSDSDSIPGPQQKVLDAIAWWGTVRVQEPTKVQVAYVAGYKVKGRVGGHYGNTLGALKGAGLIEYPSPGSVMLTDAGSDAATYPAEAPTTAGLQQMVMDMLTGPERKVLGVLIKFYPVNMTKRALAEHAGYEVTERVGGHFGNILGSLHKLQLITYPATGVTRASSMLFLEG